MDDRNRQLREQLERLDADLKQTESMDDAGRALLRQLQQDVRDLLARSDQDPGPQRHPITDRLREGIRHFELTHPTLASMMEEMVSLLSAMGI